MHPFYTRLKQVIANHFLPRLFFWFATWIRKPAGRFQTCYKMQRPRLCLRQLRDRSCIMHFLKCILSILELWREILKNPKTIILSAVYLMVTYVASLQTHTSKRKDRRPKGFYIYHFRDQFPKLFLFSFNFLFYSVFIFWSCNISGKYINVINTIFKKSTIIKSHLSTAQIGCMHNQGASLYF